MWIGLAFLFLPFKQYFSFYWDLSLFLERGMKSWFFAEIPHKIGQNTHFLPHLSIQICPLGCSCATTLPQKSLLAYLTRYFTYIAIRINVSKACFGTLSTIVALRGLYLCVSGAANSGQATDP